MILDSDFLTEIERVKLARGEDALRTLPSGLVVIVSEDKTFAEPIGCPVCLGATVGQSGKGTPTLRGQECNSAERLKIPRTGIPMEVYVNMWFCPGCGIPISRTLPRFDQNNTTTHTQ